MRRLALAVCVPLLFAVGCKRSSPTGSAPSGQSAFKTPLGPYGASSGQGGAGGQTLAGAANDAPSAAGTASTGAAPRTITESDIYKVVGNTLYVLNHYRGLQILDITDPDNPKLLGRAPIYGYPNEMYVDGTNAYIIVSDYYWFWDEPLVDGIDGAGCFHGSQLRVIDVSNPTNPQQLSSIQVHGDVTDSRIVGNVLYLVSARYSWWDNPASTDDVTLTDVVSVDVSDPMNVHQVALSEFPQGDWNQQIYVTPDTVYVATAQWVQNTNNYDTDIQYVDISDPAGQIKIRGSITVPGMVQDRWSMDEYNGFFRVASGQSWGNGDVYLTTWNVANPDAITAAGSYTLTVAESLTAARFDGVHGYLVSAANIDPLFTFDLTDPTNPQLLGSLVMTGWLDYLSPLGTTIVALGHDQSTDPSGNTTTTLAVSLINATPGQTPTLVSRVEVGQDWGWVPSTPDDYAKVFQVLPDNGLIMLPFQSWNSTDYTYVGGVQLIDFSATALTARGLIQNAGWVERGVIDGTSMALTLSDQFFQMVDITDRDNPVARGRLELSRSVQDFAPLTPDWAVQLTGDWFLGDTSLEVTPLLDPDTVSPTSEIHLPAPYGRLFTNGTMAYVASVITPTTNASPITQVQVIDLSSATTPVVRGTVALPTLVYPGYHNWYWDYGDEVAQANGNVLAFHQYSYDYWGACEGCPGSGPSNTPPHTIYLVDLSNPDAPALAATIPLNDAAWAWGMTVSGNTLLLPMYSASYVNGQYYAEYFLRRIDITNPYAPVVLPEVNLPGQFLSMNTATNEVYTLEQWWDTGSSQWLTALHTLQLYGNGAYLQGTVQLPGYVDNVIVSGTAAYVSTWWTQELGASTSSPTWVSHDQFIAIDVSNPTTPTIVSTQELPVQYAWLQKVESGRAFFGADMGVLSYDLTTPLQPVFQNFYRTEGWADDIILNGNKLFLPTGDYGVQIVDLGP